MLSDALLAHVKASEGFYPAPYLDPVGLATIGYGHRVPDLSHPPVTEAEATGILLADLSEAQRKAMILAPNLGGPPLDALTDLIFNVGAGPALRTSGTLKALQAGDWATAATKFRTWNKGRINGKLVPLAGLTTRREVGATWIESALA